MFISDKDQPLQLGFDDVSYEEKLFIEKLDKYKFILRRRIFETLKLTCFHFQMHVTFHKITMQIPDKQEERNRIQKNIDTKEREKSSTAEYLP